MSAAAECFCSRREAQVGRTGKHKDAPSPTAPSFLGNVLLLSRDPQANCPWYSTGEPVLNFSHARNLPLCFTQSSARVKGRVVPRQQVSPLETPVPSSPSFGPSSVDRVQSCSILIPKVLLE